MLEKFREALDKYLENHKGGHYAALLTGLSKAFECMPHDLIIAKLHACGFDVPYYHYYHCYYYYDYYYYYYYYYY